MYSCMASACSHCGILVYARKLAGILAHIALIGYTALASASEVSQVEEACEAGLGLGAPSVGCQGTSACIGVIF